MGISMISQAVCVVAKHYAFNMGSSWAVQVVAKHYGQ